MNVSCHSRLTNQEIIDLAYNESDSLLTRELALRLEAAEHVLDSLRELMGKKSDDRQMELELP